MTEETTLQTEMKRLETALESLLDLSQKAGALKEENEKQRQAHKASIDLIKKDYDAVLAVAETLLKSVESASEEIPQSNEQGAKGKIVAAEVSQNHDADEQEPVVIEL